LNVARLVDLCSVRSRIEHAKIRGMVLTGAAVLAVIDSVHISNSQFNLDGAPREALFIEVAPETPLLGCIGLEDVQIDACEFRNVAFIGTHEQIEILRAGIRDGSATTTISPPPFYAQLNREDLPPDQAS
jgi:hypothetical protein